MGDDSARVPYDVMGIKGERAENQTGTVPVGIQRGEAETWKQMK